jgi:hypothetical protein
MSASAGLNAVASLKQPVMAVSVCQQEGGVVNASQKGAVTHFDMHFSVGPVAEGK